MVTKEQVLTVIDKTISAGEFLAPLLPGLVDDAFISFLKWARSDAIILKWFETFVPPAPSAVTAPPEVVVDSLRRWSSEADRLSTPGGYIKLMQLLIQLATTLQELFGKSQTPVTQ
ncbi:hypothetical protein [Lacipirellula sp.]|uniref:hypothetical protein n=1 Tax=Lacipirellula sp. TaxID=2691419 RepID=UPI003D123B6A